MARSRIVLETTDRNKAALLEAVRIQGKSLTGWFEEQLSFSLPPPTTPSPVNDIVDSLRIPLESPETILMELKAFDWAFTNDDTRHFTHDLHPYPAKFIPQIPAQLIAHLSQPGDLICDPFGGSATTAVEAVRLGRRAISVDANALSNVIGRVKTGFMNHEIRTDLEQLLASVAGYAISDEARGKNWASELQRRHVKFIPAIPNIEKWFADCAIGELALLRYLIACTTGGLARDAALLAMSRVVLRVSNQDSETRYVAVRKNITPTATLLAFLESLKIVIRRLEASAAQLQYADVRFLVGDSRSDLLPALGEESVDLVVTSPPYPNATDYHLYHRFRLFWLGYDPRALGHVEIGSHLRHQRNDTGFDEYFEDMTLVLKECSGILRSGRYAAFVVGDALFKGEVFSTSDAITKVARSAGFEYVGVIDRPVHETKRSFAKPGRRIRREQLIVLRKPNKVVRVRLTPPAYRMWPFEKELRRREIASLTREVVPLSNADESIDVKLRQPALSAIRRLTFTKDFTIGKSDNHSQATWQKVLENGNNEPGLRKDPKYVTHGIHPFKGKFYPQLAKALLNISGIPLQSRVLDPFCGSGTSLLEGMLNGYSTFGCDLNPLAAKIARAKTSILTVPRSVVDLSIRALLERLEKDPRPPSNSLDQFNRDTQGDVLSWFPSTVAYKLNWLLSQARLFGNRTIVDFFEVVASSIVRDISQQDPADLRIRRRKEPLKDAPVIELFVERLKAQQFRLQKYWSIAGRQPGPVLPPTIIRGDSRRNETMDLLGLSGSSVDCVLTSPPYATALPYIDTDRLSLLTIMGIESRTRMELEENLTGSREIRRATRQALEEKIQSSGGANELPKGTINFIREIYDANSSANVGFRRANMAALLFRYFLDMTDNLVQMERVLKPGAKAFYVVGDSRTQAGGRWVAIETCKHVRDIGRKAGLTYVESIPIDVTTEAYKHIKNAITENQIIIFEKT